MNTSSCTARKAENGRCEKPGDFYFFHQQEAPGRSTQYISLMLPDGTHNCLPVVQGPAAGRAWGWDGNSEAPTLSPSIHCLGHWHGHLQAGEFKSV